MNFSANEFRYNCVETFRDNEYDFSYPTYDYDSTDAWDDEYTYEDCMREYNDNSYCSSVQL